MVGEAHGDGVEDEGSEVHLAPVEGEQAGLDLGDEQRVVGQQGQLLGLGDDRAHEVLPGLEGDVGLLEDQLGESADRHQGSAKIVCDDPDELALRAVVVPQEGVRPLQLLVEAQVLHGHPGLAGNGKEQAQVFLHEGRSARPIGDEDETQDLGPGAHRRDDDGVDSELRHELREESRVGLCLVGEQGTVLAEVPPRADLAVHVVARPVDLIRLEAEGLVPAHHLAALALEEEHEALARPESLGALAREVPVESLRARREGEGPGDLVQAEQLLHLPVELATLGLGSEQGPDPEVQLGGVEGLANDFVGLHEESRVGGALEKNDGEVRQGLADSADQGRDGRVGIVEGDEEEVRAPFDDGLDHAPAPLDEADTVARGPEEPSHVLSTSHVGMKDGDVARRSGPPDDHAFSGEPPLAGRRAMFVKRPTMDLRAPRAMGFTMYESPPAARPAA